MIAEMYCFCCGTVSKTYYSGNTEIRDRYCLECNKKFTLAQKKEREFNNIFNIIKEIKGE